MIRWPLRRLFIVSTLATIGIVPYAALAAPQGHSAAAHGNLRACRIVRKAAAQSALGETVSAGIAAKTAYFSSCSYTGTRTLATLSVLLTDTRMIRSTRAGLTAASVYKQARSSLGKVKKVRGLGNKAFWSRRFQQLWVLKGDVLIQLSGVRLPAHPLKLLERLARTATRRV